MSRDIPHEAKVLVKRMTSDSRVKLNEHWKVRCFCNEKFIEESKSIRVVNLKFTFCSDDNDPYWAQRLLLRYVLH